VKVALLYNARAAALPGFPDDAFEEYDSDATVSSIASALRGLDADVHPVEADSRLPWRLAEGRFEFAFNMAEGQGRRCREAVPAAVCELLGLPFTGSDALTLGITLDKFVAKRVVSPDVPVARGVFIESETDEAGIKALSYPVIVKPNDEGSSKGIRENPIAPDATAAVRRCRWLRERYACPVLVEEFLTGPEVTVGVTGNKPNARILGMMEIAPASGEENFVYSLEAKRDYLNQVRYFIPPRLNARTIERLSRFALTAYNLLGCRDIARVDFRLDAGGVPHFIECNPLPGLNPVTGDIVVLSRDILPYERLVQGILQDAMARTGMCHPRQFLS
jgi:D-alanine-D-alanine ligase